MENHPEHRLIIFYGSSPGAGKSTLSSLLNEQLRLHRIPVRYIYEDDIVVLKEFERFVRDIQNGNQTLIHSLLDASIEFVNQQKDRDEIVITDSIFPCFNWLIATGFYTHEQIEDFGKQLEKAVRPLNPLVVYLEIDADAALSRAVQQRGQKWLDDTLVGMNSYGYNRDKPLQDFNDIVSYFRMAGSLGLQWLRNWNTSLLVLDVASKEITELRKMVLERLGVDAIEPPNQVEVENLFPLTGTYECNTESETFDKQLRFEVVDGVLKVDSYWPNGCALVSTQANEFSLKGTNRMLHFQQFQGAVPQEVVYTIQSETCRYSRAAEQKQLAVP